MNQLSPHSRYSPPGPVRGQPPEQYQPPQPSEADLVQASNLQYVRRLATFFAVLIGVTSFFGLRQVLHGESSLGQLVIPLVVAPVLTVVLAGGWHILLGTAARPQHSRPLLSFVIAAGVGLTAVQVATTSWFLATAIGGGAAVQYHHSVVLNDFKDVLTELRARDERDRVVLGHLTRARNELESLRACEISDGCISGTPGPGTVARALAQEIDGFNRSAQELEDALARRPALLSRVRGQIELAQEASRAGDEQTFSTAINSVISGLGSANAANPSALLQALGSDSQVTSVQAVYTRLRASMDGLGEFVAPVRLPGYTPMDPATAVIFYAQNVPFAWAVAVSIDCLPLALLLLILLASYRPPEPPVTTIPYDFDYEQLFDDDDEVDETEEEEPAPVKRPRGRPRKNAPKS
ncbi:MAG: hypothetical protein ROR55_17830 [Devosia sp.]